MKRLLAIALALSALVGCSSVKGVVGKAARVEYQENPPYEPYAVNHAYLDEIRKRGILLAGVKVDSPRMGSLSYVTNEFEGMEVEIARLIAKKLFGDENKIRLKPVTPQNRVDKLNEGVIDFTIGTFTINDERKKLVHFSDSYFSEGLAFLVRKRDQMNEINQLDGKKVGIAQGTAPAWPLPGLIEERGLGIDVITYPDYPAIVGALKRGEVDAFCTVRAALFGYMTNDLKVMDETFSPGNYGIAVKLGNQDLLEFINEFLSEARADGTLEWLRIKWDL